MDIGDSNRWLFAFSAVMALVIGALIYFLFVAHPPEPQRVSSAPNQASAARATPRLEVVTARPEVATPPELAPDEAVLCGYGRMKQRDIDKVWEDAGKAADRTLDRLKERLAASKDPRQAALGLYMKGSTNTLLAIASGSGDPQVYALALHACRYNSFGACALVSAQQWANIEPDNGIPWLLVASAAGRDTDARNQAVIRASATQRFDPRFPDFLAMLQWPEIRSQAPQAWSALADQLAGMRMSLPTILYTPFIQFCSDPSVAHATRTSVCSNLTDILLEDRTMLGFSTGVGLAGLAGRPRDEVNALRERRMWYQSALAHHGERVRSDCEALADSEESAAEYSRLGERGVAVKNLDAARAITDTGKRPRR